MINMIIEAICAALYREFGETYQIYTEEVTQGMKEPCFFVFSVSPARELFFCRKYFFTNKFCIQYIPLSEKVRKECNVTAERLFQCLELLPAGEDLLRGKDMEMQVDGGVLSFFVNYDFFVYKKEKVETMGVMHEDIHAKGQV